MPGFGHPIHHPVDPRAERILALADARGVAGAHVDLLRRLTPAVAAAWGKPLPMNVSVPIAAVLLDLDFPPTMIKAIPLLARTGGLLAPSRRGAGAADRLPHGAPRRRRRSPTKARPNAGGLDDASSRKSRRVPWSEQRRLRRAALSPAGRLSLRELPLLSREACAGRASSPPAMSAGWTTSQHCPDREGRAARQPQRRRADRHAISRRRWNSSSRIFSTSGTTGLPSYVPLTVSDLDNWVTTSCRSYSASGIASG